MQARSHISTEDLQFERLVSKLREKAESCSSPRNNGAALSTQRSVKRPDELSQAQSSADQHAQRSTAMTMFDLASNGAQALNQRPLSRQRVETSNGVMKQASNFSTRSLKKKPKKMKLQDNKVRREIYLSLVQDKH